VYPELTATQFEPVVEQLVEVEREVQPFAVEVPSATQPPYQSLSVENTIWAGFGDPLQP
jgi:hypothetical protein